MNKKNAGARIYRAPASVFWRFAFPLEDDTETGAGAEVVQITEIVAIAEVGPAAIDEEAELVRLDAILDTHTCMGAGPLAAVHFKATTRVDVRREAQVIDRETQDEAARESVQGGI